VVAIKMRSNCLRKKTVAAGVMLSGNGGLKR
jgi:hypothetical protein